MIPFTATTSTYDRVDKKKIETKMTLGLERGHLKESGEGTRKVWVDLAWMTPSAELPAVGSETWVVSSEVLPCGGGKAAPRLRDSYSRYQLRASSFRLPWLITPCTCLSSGLVVR